MALTEQREKVDRDEVFLEYTKSICPVCKVVVDAEVNIRDNRVPDDGGGLQAVGADFQPRRLEAVVLRRVTGEGSPR